jgi:hypothetical protein
MENIVSPRIGTTEERLCLYGMESQLQLTYPAISRLDSAFELKAAAVTIANFGARKIVHKKVR